MFDVIIIGAGPAGLTAGIYAIRSGLNVIILQDKYSIGSQICNTMEVENYPGFVKINGSELYEKIKNHAIHLSVPIIEEKVLSIENFDKNVKLVKTKNNLYETKNIILATGATCKTAGFIGENDYIGLGVSYCATCDGAFFKGKKVAVIGSGNVAVEDSLMLSKICEKVYLIIRHDIIKADDILKKEIFKTNNIEIIYNTLIKKVEGKNKIEKAILSSEKEILIDAVFVCVGSLPNTFLYENKVLFENNYIKTNEYCETSVSGLYAVGDTRKKILYQVVTACADGANAIKNIENKHNYVNL